MYRVVYATFSSFCSWNSSGVSGYVKAKTGDATTEAVYNDWYKNVYEPTASVTESEAVVKAAKAVSK